MVVKKLVYRVNLLTHEGLGCNDHSFLILIRYFVLIFFPIYQSIGRSTDSSDGYGKHIPGAFVFLYYFVLD